MAAAELQVQAPQESSAVQKNFAPLKPLLELKRGGRKPSAYIQKAVQELFRELHRKDKDVKREINNVGQLVALMIDGKQFLAQNPYDGSWGVLPIRGSSEQRPLNVLNNIKQNLLTKWENSNPDILIRAGRNLNRAQSAAKAADVINNHYEREFYHTYFTQQECLMGCTFGTYIDRYRFDEGKVSLTLMQDIFEQKDTSIGEGYGQCGDCGYGGTDVEFLQNQLGANKFGQQMGTEEMPASCPNCGSEAVRVERPETDRLFTVAGQRPQNHGDLVCELLPLPACHWDFACRPEDSDFFIYRQRIPKGAIDRVLGNVLLPTDGSMEQDHGLEVLRALQHQGQPLYGRSQFGNRRGGFDSEKERAEHITFDEMWVGPDLYAHINLRGDEETVDGDSIPQGRLIDFFPDGFCAVGINGMSVVLALYPEKHSDHIVSGSWFMRAQSGVGRGLVDSVEIQKLFNTMNNQALQYMTSTYSPAIGYDNQIWTGNKMKYIGSPRTNIPFDLTKLPEGRKLHDSIYQFQPTAMPNQFFNFAQNFLNVMFQKTSMVTDFGNGEPGIVAQNTTATAAEIDQGNAEAINQSIFKNKADCRKRGSKITITLFRKHFPMKRSFDLGGQYGRQQSIELSAADVCDDLVFDIVKNSEMPKGPFQRQKNRMQFMGAVGGGAGLVALKQADPQTVQAMKQDFDVDMDIDEYDSVNELCLRRLDQMMAAERLGVDAPEMLVQAIDPPISPVELQLSEGAHWFAQWLSTDDGQQASRALRGAAELLAKQQFQSGVEQQAAVAGGQGTVAAAQMAPAAMGQAALEQQQQQPESTEPDPTAQLQAAQELASQENEGQENERQRQHEKEMQSVEQAHEKETDTRMIAHKERLAKMQKKAKTKAK